MQLIGHRHQASCQKGIVLILTMIILVVFASLAVSMASMSDMNLQVASNRTKANAARYAAESGLECAAYILNTISLQETAHNTISQGQANQVWTDLQAHLQTIHLDSKNVSASLRFSDSVGAGDMVTIAGASVGQGDVTFDLSFCRYDGEPNSIRVLCTGTDDDVQFSVGMNTEVTKDSRVLSYALASRGRMWLTGDTTVHGSIFSSWDRPEIACFDMTSDSSVLGTLNTILARDNIENNGYELETLNADGVPVDALGNPIGENYLDRYTDWDDKIQGYHEGINYERSATNMPGMDISDYDTSDYYDRTYLNDIGTRTTTTTTTEMVNLGTRRRPNWVEQDVTTTTDNRVAEYFPHGPDGYDDYKSGARSLNRYVYESETFTDAYVSSNRNALFENCTFEGVLYIDCSQSSSSYYNNVRFNDCTFNGVIVTNTPNSLKWQYNALYFTGEAGFNNTSDVQEATILAPHFNVNLGNTNPDSSDNNVLTGAIVGGIVDVRGNAQINGTVISMCDTTQWSSGYVTNIGATLDDGGSETTQLGDIGTITITPEEDRALPSGITTPIVIVPKQNTYTEIF